MHDIEQYRIEFYKIVPEYEIERGGQRGNQQCMEKLVASKLLALFKDEITLRVDKKYFSKKLDIPVYIYGIKGYLLSEEEMAALLQAKGETE